MPFLVGAGELPETQMSRGSLSLSSFWGGGFRQFSSEDLPNNLIDSIQNDDGLTQLLGDAAKAQLDGGSWLEALGAWRVPTILFALASSDGTVHGVASAYVALCKELSVPLIGIIQLGGSWDAGKRTLDGLPWCGWIPNEENEIGNLKADSVQTEIEVACENLKRRRIMLNI